MSFGNVGWIRRQGNLKFTDSLIILALLQMQSARQCMGRIFPRIDEETEVEQFESTSLIARSEFAVREFLRRRVIVFLNLDQSLQCFGSARFVSLLFVNFCERLVGIAGAGMIRKQFDRALQMGNCLLVVPIGLIKMARA